MKKIFTLLLAMIASVVPIFAEKVQIGNLYYNLDATTQTAKVTTSDSDQYSGDITIPASVTYNSVPYSVTGIGSTAFHDCSNLTSVSIPNCVTSIGYQAFLNCVNLTSITIPNSVTSIGNAAFNGCSSLTSINIPNGVTMITTWAFKGCSSLTSIIIPNGVTTIKERAFFGCSSLTSVSIPYKVTSIGEMAFRDCTGLTSLTCEAVNPPSLHTDVFRDVDKTIPLYVPEGSVSAYQAADQWNEFINIRSINTAALPTIYTNLNYPTQKILRDGQILILRGEKEYTLTGQEVR